MTRLLRCADLFCGIGGMTLALHDVARPVLYCEIDQDCQALLRKHMRDGALPLAPIHDDIRTLTSLPEGVDLLAAGWPCQDISAAGKCEGFEGSRSSLIKEVLRLVRASAPSMVFLENVSNFLSSTHTSDREWLLTQLTNLGYKFVYGLFAASDVGAPHYRLRFFLLACRDGVLPPVPPPATSAPWAAGEPRPRMMPKTCKQGKLGVNKRGRMLGNSVVPACAHLAFTELSRSIARGETGHLKRLNVHPTLEVRLDPFLFEFGNSANVLPALTCVKTRRGWVTPRAGNHVTPSKVLTARSATDLPTQVRFAVDTTGDRSGIVNVEWCEWLMGYPRGWTMKPRAHDVDPGSEPDGVDKDSKRRRL